MFKKSIASTIVVFCLFTSLSIVAQQSLSETIMHDGIEREYLLYIPANYTGDEVVPVVLNFHGYGSTAIEQMWYGDFRAIADTAGFLLIHPQGTLLNGITHWNVGGWTIGSTADDVGFVDAMLDSVAVDYNIDTERIFATGMSNGGFMSFLLACQLSERIAAIAPVAGSMTPEIFNNGNPQHPTPILQMHGTTDFVVPYNGNTWSLPIDDVLEYWVDYNNCNPIPSVTALLDIDPNDGSTIEHIVFVGGDNGVNVEHFMIVGGGHTWPGNILGGNGTNNDIDASAEIWKFFLRYDINGLIEITGLDKDEENDVMTKVYPNPTGSFITIENNFKNQAYQIHSEQGAILLKGRLNSKSHRVDLSVLSPGIYFLKVGEQNIKLLKVAY
jgi:polyhydroxybutyrate depolymerase